ncbi:MAG: AraC family transcriptional regulator [Alteromonadaceae bacterium]|nr:MAG: AraC family transcriptional regulator [Alteromonadaceae bacterium]
MTNTTVPASYARNLLQRAASVGCNVEALLAQVDLSRDSLESLSELPALIYGQLYQSVMRETENEWFGIFAVGRVPLGAFRLMCLTMLQCDNLEQAIVRMGEFSEICRGLGVRYTVEYYGGRVKLRLSPSRSMVQGDFDEKVANAEPQSLLASLITHHRLAEWLIDEEIPVDELGVTFAQPINQLPLSTFAVKVTRYHTEHNYLSYASRYLSRPIVQNQDSLLTFLSTAPYHLFTEDVNHIKPVDKVRSLLKKEISVSLPSADVIAARLNVSVTTLRRQLQRDGTSYQKLKDECRMEAAFHFLNCLELSNNDIADKLGFDEPSAFFRSFKKWTGLTPGEYRAKQREQSAAGDNRY